MLRELRNERAHPDTSTFNKATIHSGHMIDKPGRAELHFHATRKQLYTPRSWRNWHAWKIGADELAVCRGACGANILFAEKCLQRSAQVRLLPAQELDRFVEKPRVRVEVKDWVARALREKCEVASRPARLGETPNSERTVNASKVIDISARTNLWIINTVRVEAPSARPFTRSSSTMKIHRRRAGGTSDFEERVR